MMMHRHNKLVVVGCVIVSFLRARGAPVLLNWATGWCGHIIVIQRRRSIQQQQTVNINKQVERSVPIRDWKSNESSARRVIATTDQMMIIIIFIVLFRRRH